MMLSKKRKYKLVKLGHIAFHAQALINAAMVFHNEFANLTLFEPDNEVVKFVLVC